MVNFTICSVLGGFLVGKPTEANRKVGQLYDLATAGRFATAKRTGRDLGAGRAQPQAERLLDRRLDRSLNSKKMF